MLKERKSIIVMAGLTAALASVPVQAQQLIDLRDPQTTKPLEYLDDFRAYFTTSVPAHWDGSTGTGTLDPFLTLQGSPSERGINGDSDGPYRYQEVTGGDRTRPLPRSETSVLYGRNIPGMVCSGSDDPQCDRHYLEFLLDANESKSDPYLLMSELKVFISKDLSDTTSGPAFDGRLSTLESWAAANTHDTVKVFDLDLKDIDNDGDLDFFDRAVMINYALNGGSGWPDLTVYLPQIESTSASHVYLYTRFGCTTTAGANHDANCAGAIALAGGGSVTPDAGFEEWAVRATPIQEAPAPSAILGVVAAFGYMRQLRRRLKADQAGRLAA